MSARLVASLEVVNDAICSQHGRTRSAAVRSPRGAPVATVAAPTRVYTREAQRAAAGAVHVLELHGGTQHTEKRQ